jgi:hypothetical protein
MLSALSSSSMFAFNGLFGTGQAVRYVFESLLLKLPFLVTLKQNALSHLGK